MDPCDGQRTNLWLLPNNVRSSRIRPLKNYAKPWGLRSHDPYVNPTNPRKKIDPSQNQITNQNEIRKKQSQSQRNQSQRNPSQSQRNPSQSQDANATKKYIQEIIKENDAIDPARKVINAEFIIIELYLFGVIN